MAAALSLSCVDVRVDPFGLKQIADRIQAACPEELYRTTANCTEQDLLEMSVTETDHPSVAHGCSMMLHEWAVFDRDGCRILDEYEWPHVYAALFSRTLTMLPTRATLMRH